MATITLTPNTVTHTLPSAFYGFGMSRYFYADATNSTWQTYTSALHMEIFRGHQFGAPNDQGAGTSFEYWKSGILALSPNPVAMIQPSIGPQNIPSTKADNDTSNVQANSVHKRSPTDVADIYEDWITAGIVVPWVEMCNEWTNMYTLTGSDGQNGDAWFSNVSGYTSGQGEQPVRRACESWGIVNSRQWATALRSRATTLGTTVKIANWVFGDTQGASYVRTFADDFIVGTLTSGRSNPNGTPSNVGYCDTFIAHPYAQDWGGGDQSALNSLLYPTFTANKSTLYAYYDTIRGDLDSNGGSAVAMGWDECSIITDRWLGAISDAMTAIIAAVNQSVWKLDMCVYHSINRSSNAGGGYPADGMYDGDGIFTRNSRYYTQRDIISPFLRLYKKQIIAGGAPPAGVSGSGNTPATSDSNSVPRINAAAGLNSGNTTLGILIVNGDLTNSESVTINFGTTATGDATYHQFPNGAGGYTVPTAGTITSPGTSTTRTIGAGEVILIEVPISLGGGGGGGPVPAPTQIPRAVTSVMRW